MRAGNREPPLSRLPVSYGLVFLIAIPHRRFRLLSRYWCLCNQAMEDKEEL
jgi:hypothetical protein